MPGLGDCEQRPGRKAATWGVEVGPGMNKGRAGRNYRDLAFSVRFTMKFFWRGFGWGESCSEAV